MTAGVTSLLFYEHRLYLAVRSSSRPMCHVCNAIVEGLSKVCVMCGDFVHPRL
jgi:hypothetical protein